MLLASRRQSAAVRSVADERRAGSSSCSRPPTRNNGLIILLLVAYLVVVAGPQLPGPPFRPGGQRPVLRGPDRARDDDDPRRAPVPSPSSTRPHPDNFETLMSVIRREQYPPLNPFERAGPAGLAVRLLLRLPVQAVLLPGPGPRHADGGHHGAGSDLPGPGRAVPGPAPRLAR